MRIDDPIRDAWEDMPEDDEADAQLRLLVLVLLLLAAILIVGIVRGFTR